ncbi:hypothetical protein Q7O_001603 [Pectobacterium carotovorum subsp. carotovorum PCCS1]|nr:hypothetical protein [Pectobacterium carotovorum subsp. carotovorum PCCS1]
MDECAIQDKARRTSLLFYMPAIIHAMEEKLVIHFFIDLFSPNGKH